MTSLNIPDPSQEDVIAAARELSTHLDAVDDVVDRRVTASYKAERLELLLRACGRVRPTEPAQRMPESSAPPRKETEVARRIRAHELARGRALPQIAAVISEQCGPLFGTSKIKAHRLAAGLNLSDIVHQIRALYEADGKPAPRLGETLLSAYESGYKRPGPEYLHYVSAVYRVDPEALGYQGPCGCGRDHSVGVASGQTLSRPDEDEALLRLFIPQLLGVVDAVHSHASNTTGPLRAVDQLRVTMDDALENDAVSVTMVDQWEETILRYCRSYQAEPSLRLLYRALLDFVEVRRLCEQRQARHVEQRLFRIAAQLSGIVGILLTVLGEDRRARSFFSTAHTAAYGTGERGLRAWVTARESLVPLYYGDPAEALRLARQAQSLAGCNPSVAAAMAPAIEARALGQLTGPGQPGAVSTARQALTRGWKELERLPETQGQDLVLGFTNRQMLFYEGDTLTGFGEHRSGDEALHRALQLYSPTEIIDRTLVKLDRAACALHAGDPSKAALLTQAAILDIDPQHRSRLLVQRAQQLATAVTQRHGELQAIADLEIVLASALVGDTLTTSNA